MALTKAPEELLDKSLTSALTVTVADNSDTLTIVSTDADDAFGPFLNLHRNSSSPADNDGTGVITFAGENDNNEEIDYAQIQTASTDVSDGSEDGTFIIQTMVAGTSRDRITISPSETAVNDNPVDVDFRVESDSQTHALFVDSGANTVSFNQIGVINAASYFSLQTNTSDGSDTGVVALDGGGGAGSTSRGSFFAVYGNEHAFGQAGNIYGQTGASGNWIFATGSNPTERFRIADGITFTGKAGTSPIFEMINSDNEDNDTGRETTLRFSGHRSGGEDVINAQISGHHYGSSDDDRGQLIFFTNNGSGLTEKMRIIDDGGITFNGDTASANALDDYEEGLYGASDQSGAGLTFTQSHNRYTKIGRVVHAHVLLTYPSTSNTSMARIGIPFTCSGDSDSSATGGVLTEQNIDTSKTYTASVNYSDSLVIRENGSRALQNNELSGKNIRFIITYFTP